MTRRPRIAFLSEHSSPVAVLGGEDAGGQNVYVDEVSRNLGSLGFDVDVFVRRDDTTSPDVIAWSPGVRIVHLEAGPPEFVLKDDIWPFMPNFRDAFLRFSVSDDRRYDLIHGNFWMSGWVAAQLRHKLDIPVVQIFHAVGKTKQRHQGSLDTSPAGRIAIEHEVIRSVDRLIAQCPSERQELVEDYGADPAKVVVVPSGVNVARFKPSDRLKIRQQLGLDPDAFVVAYVGRMLPRKDVRNVVRASAILMGQTEAPVQLLLVGGETLEPDPVTTPEIGELQRLAHELGIADRVTFTGRRQPDELRHYYCAGDVAVTTPWYEPYGLTPLEAMACGVPIIGSAVGGITFTVQDGETGFLVPSRDPEALAGKLRYLLVNPDERTRMGHLARLRVEREFTWPVVAERTAALYHELLQPVTAATLTVSVGTDLT
ncbi:glycosyltransferase family 1 protein [soil metagenome]